MYYDKWLYDGFLDKMSSPSFDVEAYVYLAIDPTVSPAERAEHDQIAFVTIPNTTDVQEDIDRHVLDQRDKEFEEVFHILQGLLKDRLVEAGNVYLDDMKYVRYYLVNFKGTSAFDDILEAFHKDYQDKFHTSFKINSLKLSS